MDWMSMRKPEEEIIFFVWNNTADPQYIPLRPISERLNGVDLRREHLMASLYRLALPDGITSI